MNVIDSLISLASSEDPTNHELFHLYHDLDAKLETLDYFWNNIAETLPYRYNSASFYIYSTFITDLLFNFRLVDLMSELYHTRKIIKVKYLDTELYQILGGGILLTYFEETKKFFEDFVIRKHKEYHGE